MDIRFISVDDDKSKISKIYEESWKTAYHDIIPQDYLDSIPKGNWNNALSTPGWDTLLCIENGEYIGTSSFCKSRFEQYPDSGEIISVYLLPEYWGKGCGRILLRTALNELGKQGFKDAFLWVLEENVRARHFYESNGFSCTNDYLEDNIGGKPLREIRYIYKLKC